MKRVFLTPEECPRIQKRSQEAVAGYLRIAALNRQAAEASTEDAMGSAALGWIDRATRAGAEAEDAFRQAEDWEVMAAMEGSGELEAAATIEISGESVPLCNGPTQLRIGNCIVKSICCQSRTGLVCDILQSLPQMVREAREVSRQQDEGR